MYKKEEEHLANIQVIEFSGDSNDFLIVETLLLLRMYVLFKFVFLVLGRIFL